MPRNKEFELIQDLIIKAHNPNVKATFRDDIADGDTPEAWGDNAERALKNLMLVKDTDTADTTIIKLLLALMYRLDKVENEVGTTGTYFQPWADKEQRPMVQIQFIEVPSNSNKDRAKYVHEFSFRLKGKETEQITRLVLDELRREIKTQFPSNFRFRAGRRKCTYWHPESGFRSIIHAETDVGAKELLKRLCNVNDVVFDTDYFTAKGVVSNTKVKQKQIRYKEQTITLLNRRYEVAECMPYRAYLYPGSGLKTELLLVF
jgi:hypothetical protein